jgi:hypothetical protein
MRRISLLVLAPLLAAGCSSAGTTSSNPQSPPVPVAASGPVSSPVPASTPAGASQATQAAVPAEKNPPGDIPDNLAFIGYTNTSGRYRFTHPEGWAETTRSSSVTFTDKLNGVQAMTGTATTAPTIASARQQDVPALARSQAAFELRDVTAVSLPAGPGVQIVYRRNSAPDPVTGRQYRDEVERYELVSGGREVIVELFGPVGADNVDAYKTMITSLRLL